MKETFDARRLVPSSPPRHGKEHPFSCAPTPPDWRGCRPPLRNPWDANVSRMDARGASVAVFGGTWPQASATEAETGAGGSRGDVRELAVGRRATVGRAMGGQRPRLRAGAELRLCCPARRPDRRPDARRGRALGAAARGPARVLLGRPGGHADPRRGSRHRPRLPAIGSAGG